MNTKREKSEGRGRVHYSFEVEPDDKFAAEFCLRIEGGTFQRIVSEAVRQYATALKKTHGVDWRDYWDESPGVAMCKIFAGDIRLNKNEHALKAFVLAHRPFFYRRRDSKWVPNRTAIETLWPKILVYVDHWNQTKERDPWATGAKMTAVLGDSAPAWGPGHEVEA